MTYVVDACAAVRAQIDDLSAAWLDATVQNAELVIAPALFQSEVANALSKYVRAGKLDLNHAEHALRLCLGIPEYYADDSNLAPRALRLAARNKTSAYDMFYVALALESAAILVTADKRLAETARLSGIGVVDAPEFTRD